MNSILRWKHILNLFTAARLSFSYFILVIVFHVRLNLIHMIHPTFTLSIAHKYLQLFWIFWKRNIYEQSQNVVDIWNVDHIVWVWVLVYYVSTSKSFNESTRWRRKQKISLIRIDDSAIFPNKQRFTHTHTHTSI